MHHKVKITDEEAVVARPGFLNAISPIVFCQTKAIVIDEAGASKAQPFTCPAEMKSIEKKLKKLEQEKSLFSRIETMSEVESIHEEEEQLRESLDSIWQMEGLTG
jgi:ATP-dependent Clp protease ATP-binding subunit ClpA